MTKKEAFAEMKELLGQVPGFFEDMPDECVASEWQLFKQFELEETAVPPKYRELIGVAVAASQHCWYCTNFHSGMAKFNGASDAEVQEAALLAKLGTGWSTYLNGTQYDKDRFLKELEEVGTYIKSRR